jgi:hypothetical protein
MATNNKQKGKDNEKAGTSTVKNNESDENAEEEEFQVGSYAR